MEYHWNNKPEDKPVGSVSQRADCLSARHPFQSLDISGPGAAAAVRWVLLSPDRHSKLSPSATKGRIERRHMPQDPCQLEEGPSASGARVERALVKRCLLYAGLLENDSVIVASSHDRLRAAEACKIWEPAVKALHF